MSIPIPDSERIAVIAAEREVSAVETILLNSELSELGKDSALRRLDIIRATLTAFRARYGLAA